MTTDAIPATASVVSAREQDRLRAIEILAVWMREQAPQTTALYVSETGMATARLEDLFSNTCDLRRLAEGRANAAVVSVARHLVGGPATSEDDLAIIAGSAASVDRSRTKIAFIADNLDPILIPWVAQGRAPTPTERQVAIIATAASMAGARCATERRRRMGQKQEGLTKEAVEAAGFRPGIWPLAPGEYCGETKIAGNKADLVVRLLSGIYLLIECKSSASILNSYKRGGHEVTDKPRKWRQALGADTVVVSVLGGAFHANTLAEIEGAEVLVFWDHALGRLTDFLAE